MISAYKTSFNPLIQFVAKPFSWIHPDILSFGTLIVSIPGFYFLAQGNSLLGCLFILGAAFDSIDGAVARMTGKVSKFGGILDATIDRVYEGILLLAIGSGGLAPWELLFTLFISSVSVSYIKAKAEAATAEASLATNQFSVGIVERFERLTGILAGLFLNGLFTGANNEILQIVLIILTIGSALTLIWRGWVIRRVTQAS